MSESRYCDRIPTFELFEGFTPDGAERLLESGQVEEVSEGTQLVREGEASTFVLLVLDGRLSVFVERDGRDVALTEEGPGAIVGEIGVLSGIPRSASVRAAEPTTILRWSDDAFRKMLLRDVPLSHRIFSRLLRTLVEKEQSLIAEILGAGDRA